MTDIVIKTAINQLEYDFDDFSLEHFIFHVKKLRQREIILLPTVLAFEISALWVKREIEDYIFYNTAQHDIHQTHSILHEIAHIVLDHSCVPVNDILPKELLAMLQNGKIMGRPRMPKTLLQDDPEEQAAESFVYLIQEQIIDTNRLEHLTTQGSSNQMLDKYVSGIVI